MLKNRAVQVTWVKKPEEELPSTMDDSNTETVALATVAVKDVMQEATKLIVVIIAVDTVRKVIVALATK